MPLFAGVSLSSPATAACDSQCITQAMDAGERAAQKALFPELARDGALGRLMRAEVGLEVCGVKGKSKAITKLRDARFDKVIGDRVDGQPLGSEQDSEEQANITFASFIGTAKALMLGYALGYHEQTLATVSTDPASKKSMCQGYSKFADRLLFGDI